MTVGARRDTSRAPWSPDLLHYESLPARQTLIHLLVLHVQRLDVLSRYFRRFLLRGYHYLLLMHYVQQRLREVLICRLAAELTPTSSRWMEFGLAFHYLQVQYR